MNEHETADDRALSALIRATATRYPPPPALRARVLAATGTSMEDTSRPKRFDGGNLQRSGWRFAIGRLTGVAATAFVCGAIASWLAIGVLTDAKTRSRVEDDVIGAHVRAVMMA